MSTSVSEPMVEHGVSHDLRVALGAARRRAGERGRPVLAAHTVPIRDLSPLAVYSAARDAGLAELWYWEQPSAGRALVGIGVAARLERGGPAAMADVARAWRSLAAASVEDRSTDATADLAAFAGFAFDPAAPRTALWAGFSGALLVVPRLLVRWGDGAASATVAALVGPGDAVDAHLRRLESTLALLDSRDAQASPAMGAPAPALAVADGPAERMAYEHLVALAREQTRPGELRKVVAARAVEAETPEAFDPAAVLARLRGAYPSATIYAVQRGDATFIGATPEWLARVSGGRLETMALAGTAPRGATSAEDDALAAALYDSPKICEEHAIVVATIRGVLAPLCADIHVANAPHLRRLPNVQHLETPIAATLTPGRDLLDVAAALHPTPAVGGLPRDIALAFIRRHEGLDRGWYAGPLGWVDTHGDGELVVALRSALLRGGRATLFAGCGIVRDSEPTAEYEESRFKLRAMLGALGGDAAGGAR